MAVWQFSIVLIPKSWAQENEYNGAGLLQEYGYDTELTWLGRQPEKSVSEICSRLFPETSSWSDGIRIWGNTEEHDIQVCIENDQVCDIRVRLELRQDLQGIVENVVEMANAMNCVFLFPEYREISNANEFVLRRALANSRAKRFVSDPEAFLREIERPK